VQFSPGFAFLFKGHLWFLLSDPANNGGKVLGVNLTTLDQDCLDTECQLTDHEYVWIEANHPTVVAFSLAMEFDLKKLGQAFEAGVLQRNGTTMPVVPTATIEIVRKAALSSKLLSPAHKRLLA